VDELGGPWATARWGVRLDYAVEVEPLGTAGGVRNAADLVSGLIVVLNGDVLTDVDLSAMLRFHAQRGARATIFLTRVEDPSLYGLVEVAGDGRVRGFVEKPSAAQRTADTVNAGIYVLDGALLARIPPGRVASMEREFFRGSWPTPCHSSGGSAGLLDRSAAKNTVKPSWIYGGSGGDGRGPAGHGRRPARSRSMHAGRTRLGSGAARHRRAASSRTYHVGPSAVWARDASSGGGGRRGRRPLGRVSVGAGAVSATASSAPTSASASTPTSAPESCSRTAPSWPRAPASAADASRLSA
jgi:hypothetical protein